MSQVLWTSADAAVATGGETGGAWLASGLSIDTRTLQPGDLFIALKDVRDGHDFVEAAFKAGAAAALVSRDVEGGPFLKVDDVLSALEALGIAARARCGAVRIAVTGSVGKTSVKEMLARIFRAHGPAHWPEKSFNNHWGVPLTLARMPQLTQRAVFEIGMSTPGEIAPRSDMVRPHCAIVTKIAGVHLEGLGSLDAVAEEKSGIFAGLEAGGVAVLPSEDDYFDFLGARAREAAPDVEILSFGTSAGTDARVLEYRPDGHHALAKLEVLGQRVTLKLEAGGGHWATNAAAAVLASAAIASLSVEEAGEALSGFSPPPGRGVVQSLHLPDGGTATLIDDSYNANPTSMRAALAALSARPGSRRLAALGQMGELGSGAERFHADLAGPVVEAGIEAVWLAGGDMQALASALPKTVQQHWSANAEGLLEGLKKTLCDGDLLLIKGSNSSGMVMLADALRQWSVRPDDQVMDASSKGAG